MLQNQKILITGATGKIAFPIARALSERNEVWGAARLGNPGDRDKLAAAGTYGPLGGAPADRLELMLKGKPIRLHPDKPNNYNPIYEDDYVEFGIRAMEVAAVPPLVVNWGGSETVSAEDYCAYMGELVGVKPIFEYTAEAHTPLWPDVTFMHEVLGRTKVHWRDGFRRMIEARHPELLRPAKDAAK